MIVWCMIMILMPSSGFRWSTGWLRRQKQSARQIESLCTSGDLVAIRQVRNPNAKRFTRIQKHYFYRESLVFWLIDNVLQEGIDQADIIRSIKSGHSTIVLVINGVDCIKCVNPPFENLMRAYRGDKDYVHVYQNWTDGLANVED